MPKVSVIIPVYNVKDYLRECVDSVINQTLTDIEIILVDDGSTDGSDEICDEYAGSDARIRVIHKENEGLSCARNDGIAMAQAEYVMFVDSDDWTEPTFCELPYREAVKNDSDLVLFLHSRVNPDGSVKQVTFPLKDGPISEAQALDYNVNLTNGTWVGFYKKSLFDTIKFPAGKYYEDVGTIHRLIHASERISYIGDFLYDRRIDRPGSITTTLETKVHPDLKEMYRQKIRDLYSWGYRGFAQKCARSMLIHFGYRQDDQKYFVDFVKRIKGLAPREFKWKSTLLLNVFRLLPAMFDRMCARMGKRI